MHTTAGSELQRQPGKNFSINPLRGLALLDRHLLVWGPRWFCSGTSCVGCRNQSGRNACHRRCTWMASPQSAASYAQSSDAVAWTPYCRRRRGTCGISCPFLPSQLPSLIPLSSFSLGLELLFRQTLVIIIRKKGGYTVLSANFAEGWKKTNKSRRRKAPLKQNDLNIMISRKDSR